MHPLSVLLLGDAEQAEFGEAQACLRRGTPIHEARDLDAAASLAQRESPDLIVVAQSRPGQFSHAALHRLRRLAPLAPIVGLMGSWCEGETRTGSPWPASARLYWHQWPTRCKRQLARIANGRPSPWTLPATATEEERLLADIEAHGSETPRTTATRGLVAIRSLSSETAAWLLTACRSRGLAAVWQRRPPDARTQDATAAIFDAADLSNAEFAELGRFAAAMRPCPLIALLSFPRIDDQRRALSAGATVTLSKPLAIEDLFWEIDRSGQ
ncbi:MAG: hypothetical protein ABFC63_02650 [Thermoguttaceae bacterium]